MNLRHTIRHFARNVCPNFALQCMGKGVQQQALAVAQQRFAQQADNAQVYVAHHAAVINELTELDANLSHPVYNLTFAKFAEYSNAAAFARAQQAIAQRQITQGAGGDVAAAQAQEDRAVMQYLFLVTPDMKSNPEIAAQAEASLCRQTAQAVLDAAFDIRDGHVVAVRADEMAMA
ncbi:MAG: hypothetical protein WAX89_05735 [Alphaproteobacteria bacterium]